METKFNLDGIFIITNCCVKKSFLNFLIFSQLDNINYVTPATNDDTFCYCLLSYSSASRFYRVLTMVYNTQN
jgi:hypothetical protein